MAFLERLYVFNYLQAANTANSLLSNFGQDVVITVIGDESFDPDTQVLTSASVDYTAKAVLLDYKGNERGSALTGSVETNDKKLLVSPLGLTVSPTPNDLVTVDSVVWRIINVKAVKPALITVLYELQVRIN